MAKSSEQRYLSLPAWAKREIDERDAEIDRLLALVATFAGKQETSTSVQRHDAGGEAVTMYLPDKDGVDFELPTGAKLHVERDRNSLRVTEKTDTGQILVVPVRTGVINIGVINAK